MTPRKIPLFFLEPGPTQMLLFKPRFVLKLDMTEMDPLKYDWHKLFLLHTGFHYCVSQKTKTSAFVFKAIQKATWLRFLRYHYILQPSHSCKYGGSASSVLLLQVITEMPAPWGIRRCRISYQKNGLKTAVVLMRLLRTVPMVGFHTRTLNFP